MASPLLVPGIALMTAACQVWNQSFPSPRWTCLNRQSEPHLPRCGNRVFLLLGTVCPQHLYPVLSSCPILEGVPLSATRGCGWLPYHNTSSCCLQHVATIPHVRTRGIVCLSQFAVAATTILRSIFPSICCYHRQI